MGLQTMHDRDVVMVNSTLPGTGVWMRRTTHSPMNIMLPGNRGVGEEDYTQPWPYSMYSTTFPVVITYRRP